MNRRTFLTGSALVYTAVSGGLDTSGTPSSEETHRASVSTTIERDIQENRTTELNVVVVDATEEPIPNADVSVEMQAHDFRFGTAVNAPLLLEETEDDDPYRSNLLDLFNAAVLENRHKWWIWEDDDGRELADDATQWLLDNGLTVRGHTAMWQDFDSGAVPEDVIDKYHSDDPDRSEYLEDRTMSHVWEIVHAYDGQLTDWDVLNEHLSHYQITEAINPEYPPQEAPPVVGWFATAAEASTETDFYYNDFNIVAGDDEERREQLDTLITYLQEFDAPLDGIGLQGHFGSSDEAVDPETLRELLDRYASFDLNIQITEYDTFGSGWSEEDEAAHLEGVLKTLFSHPATVGFYMWGFWDGSHWQDNAPLFRDDWSAKPAYDVYTDLVFDEWWTDETGETGPTGHYSTQAFLGEYEITVTTAEAAKTVETSVKEDTADETVVISL